MLRKILYTIIASIFCCFTAAHIAGCAKEYSFEGAPIDTLPPQDTTAINKILFSQCHDCIDQNAPDTIGWHFRYDTFLLCGNITAAIISPGKDAFTFFGPSACSWDTGLVMTVYLNQKLDRDLVNVYSSKALFQYYDNATGPDIFISNQVNRVELFMNSYDHTTGIAKGIFSGVVLTNQNNVAAINQGSFVIKFR